MFKNAKLLKGSTIALACALVLCLGVVFGIYYAGAAANTVTLYVSNHGDNTTGADEASAFTSILDATEAANDMALKPGTELRILVVERVSVTTNKINSQVLDTAGNVVPVTVEGYGYDGDEGNRSEIYCEWYDTNNNASYRQWVLLDGDVTFRGVKFLSKLHDTYAENKTSGITNRYCTRYFYANGYHATLDNVVFTTEAPANIKWTLYADTYASKNVSATKAGHSGFVLKNGDYTNCSAVRVSSYPTPNYDLDVSFENAKIPPVTIFGNSNAGVSVTNRHQKANSIKVTFGAGTYVKENSSGVSVIVNSGSGYNVVPKGAEINYEDGCEMQGMVQSSSVSTESVVCDLTNNFRGGIFNDYVYAGPTGPYNGKLVNNVSGGTFNGRFFAGNSATYSSIENNISGGSFLKEVYLGTGYGGTVKEGVTNTITGGTFDSYVYLNTYDGVVNGTSYNYIYGGTFNKSGAYATHKGALGIKEANGSYVSSADVAVVNVIGQVDKDGNLISAPTFKATLSLGGAGWSDAAKNFVGGEVQNTFHGGTFAKVNCGGTYGKLRSVTNTFYGGTFNGDVNGGAADSSATLVGNVTNNVYGGTFKTYPTTGAAKVNGNVVNNYNDVTITAEELRGTSVAVTGNVTNTFNNCKLNATFYAATNAKVDGTITNNFNGGTYNRNLYLSAYYTLASEEINNFNGGTYNGTVFGAGILATTSDKTTTAVRLPKLTNNVNGGTFNDAFCVGPYRGHAGDITTNITGDAVFNGTFYAGFYGFKEAVVSVGNSTVNIYAGTFADIKGNCLPDAVNASQNNTYKINVYRAAADAPADALTFAKAVKGAKATAVDLMGNVTINGATENSTFTGDNGTLPTLSVDLYGGDIPIYLGASASIYADSLKGAKNIVFCQTAQWQDGATYVSLPDSVDASRIATVNKSSGVAGTATVQTDGGRLVVVGGSGTGTVIGTVAPKLNGYSFALDNKLKVCFFIPVEQIEAYINFAGAWDYSVAMEGIEVLTGRITDVAEIPAASIANGAGDVPCFVLTTDFGIAATDFDQKITVTWSGNEDVFAKSAYELLEGGIGSASTKAEIATLLKAIYNYGIEAENVFEGKNVALKYDVTYTGTYNGAPSRTSAEDGFEFFATSLSLDGEVALNFYLKLADGVAANQMTFTAKSAAGAVLDASKITVKAVDGVEEYDVIVSVKLSVPEMANAYTLSAALADDTVVATCTNSIANSCAGYIAAQNKFAPVSKALLAYIEKATAAL